MVQIKMRYSNQIYITTGKAIDVIFIEICWLGHPTRILNLTNLEYVIRSIYLEVDKSLFIETPNSPN